MTTDVQGLPDEYVRLLGALDDAYSRGNWKHETEVIYGQLSAYVRALIERQAAELEQARNLLRGAQTHLLDGDNSIWRSQVDEFVRKADGLHFDAALRESQGKT